MLTSKSPKDVARVALEVGKDAFSDYSHKYSPHKFTRPQLFACLVLRAFFGLDYRGIRQLLLDTPDLCRTIGIGRVPHYTTLQKASVRLIRDRRFATLLASTVRRVMGRRRRVQHAAADSTGLDPHHASRYFVWRKTNQAADTNRPKKQVSYRRFGKLMVLVCCVSHAILSATASAGPTPDIDQLGPLFVDRVTGVDVQRLVADAGFDSASNHRFLRERYGVATTIPPRHGRPPKDPRTKPADYWRRRMKTHFNKKAYRNRAQVETVFSMIKRNLGASLAGRSYQSRRRDMLLRVLTHNIMLAFERLFYRAKSRRLRPD